jgi:hypothetical protein
LSTVTGLEDDDEEHIQEAYKALQSIISQDALDWMADNARELGLNYDTPLSAFVRSSDEDKAEVMERVIDKAIEAQKEKIGCVNHDCDQCKAVQEPLGYIASMAANDLRASIYRDVTVYGEDLEDTVAIYTTPPAAQPAVQEGRDWSLLEATQESLREHMAEIKRLKAATVQDWKTLAEEQAETIAKMTSEKYPFVHIRIDASEAEKEGALRDKLIELGWTPPAPQPVPVKTYHDGKPWPVAPKPWVGLTDAEIEQEFGGIDEMLRDCVYRTEAKLKELNT